MLKYEKLEQAGEFTYGKRVKLERKIVLNGEEHREIVLAHGQGLGSKTLAVFIEDELIVEGLNEYGALANLVDLSDNLEAEISEK